MRAEIALFSIATSAAPAAGSRNLPTATDPRLLPTKDAFA